MVEISFYLSWHPSHCLQYGIIFIKKIISAGEPEPGSRSRGAGAKIAKYGSTGSGSATLGDLFALNSHHCVIFISEEGENICFSKKRVEYPYPCQILTHFKAKADNFCTTFIDAILDFYLFIRAANLAALRC